MGAIWFRRANLVGTLNEMVGYKSGISLNTEQLADIARERADDLVGQEDQDVRIRSEEFEELLAVLLYGGGNVSTPSIAPAVLAPIQKRIRWVLEGVFCRQKEDRQIGQGDWGECWWLPEEHTEYVRKQLRKVTGRDYAMQCARCKLPISLDGSSRANHQRARARRGQPMYHEACRREQTRLRKKLHWRRKTSSKEFVKVNGSAHG